MKFQWCVFDFFLLQTASDLTEFNNCPKPSQRGCSFLTLFFFSKVCVWVLHVCSLRDKPGSRHTNAGILPVKSHPQRVCVSRWVLSFLCRCSESTGGLEEREQLPPLVLWTVDMGLFGLWQLPPSFSAEFSSLSMLLWPFYVPSWHPALLWAVQQSGVVENITGQASILPQFTSTSFVCLSCWLSVSLQKRTDGQTLLGQ